MIVVTVRSDSRHTRETPRGIHHGLHVHSDRDPGRTNSVRNSLFEIRKNRIVVRNPGECVNLVWIAVDPFNWVPTASVATP